MYELFETLENECSIYFYDEASEYLGNQGYKIIYEEDTINDMINDLFKSYMNKNKIKYYKEKINNLTEEKQLEVFKDYKLTEKSIVEELVYALTQLDKNLVQEELKYYGYIK